MSLLKPTPGELCDRMSILWRKIIEGEWAGRQMQVQRDEYAELQEALIPYHIGPALILKLAAINAALWEAENNIREKRGLVMRATFLGARIAQLNDTRNGLIAEINALFDAKSEVKMYGPS